jgi:MOSC domain-containing protein YiiM
MHGELVSVNIGVSRQVEYNGRQVMTGIFKTPTDEPQQVTGVHIGNDVQADTNAHGGYDKAIYAYASEDYEWWASELARDAEPGLFGENLTTRGIDVSGANVGDRWSIGSTVLEVSEPRVPCFKLGIRTGVKRIQQSFSSANRPGAYLRIVEPGELTVGDAITVDPTTQPTISVAEMAAIYHGNHAEAIRFAEVSLLSEPWLRWARDASQ